MSKASPDLSSHWVIGNSKGKSHCSEVLLLLSPSLFSAWLGSANPRDGLQPTSDGLHPSSNVMDGLQPENGPPKEWISKARSTGPPLEVEPLSVPRLSLANSRLPDSKSLRQHIMCNVWLCLFACLKYLGDIFLATLVPRAFAV